MSATVLILLAIGFLLLLAGAEALVRGASRLAALVGISPLAIGLTVVAFGTSSPELAVSLQSVLSDQGGISIGNVVGSNILNVLLILGASSAIAPLIVSQQLVRLDVPIMIGVSVLLLFFALDGRIGTSDGIVLFIGAVTYTLFLFFQSRKQKNAEDEYAREYGIQESSTAAWPVNLALIVGGFALLVLGSHLLVENAVTIAEAWGMSELVIGLTIVSIGTSLPEMLTSIVASLRGERDIAVGNVVGSNIFNILVVIGLSSAIDPEGIDVSTAALYFDIPVMIAVAVACLPIFFTDNIITRWEGLLFLAYYVAYATYLFLDSTGHDLLPIFSTVLLAFVIPITALTLGLLTWRAIRSRSKRAAGCGSEGNPSD